MDHVKYKTVIVGLGNISQSMLKYFVVQPWFQPVGVVDIREEALNEFANILKLSKENLYTDLDKALASTKPDVVIINTPSRLHYAQTKAALLAGAHVLVAKPITNHFEEAVELVQLADSLKLKLTVGQQIRFNRHYQSIKQFVNSGKLGTIESINFLNAKHRPEMLECTMPHPALYEMTCHHFDSLMDGIGDYSPDWIFCDAFQPSWSPYLGPCMVNATIVFNHPTHAPLHINYHAGFSSQSHNYQYRLEGTKGVLRSTGIHMSNDTMNYEFAERGKALKPITIDDKIETIDPFYPFFERWAEYMNGGKEPSFSGRNNLKVFALLCAAEESTIQRMPVKVAQNKRYAIAFKK